MPADFESGYFVREPAWHGMGVVVDDYPGSWDEARKLAGLEWEPVSAPMFGFTGVNDKGETVYDPVQAVEGSGSYAVDPDQQRIIRSDTGALLGAVTKWYQVITHAEMGEIVEAIEGQPNVKYETTVVLQGGKAVASVVRLDEPVALPGDASQTLPYMALTTEADRNGTVFTFNHGAKWRERIEEARQAIRGLRTDFARYVEVAEEWARTPVTRKQEKLFVTEFIPMPPGEVISDRVARNVEEARQAVLEILASPTVEGAGIRGTAFGLIQGAGEYLDHSRAYQSKDTLFGRQLLRPEKRKSRAVSIVRELVGA